MADGVYDAEDSAIIRRTVSMKTLLETKENGVNMLTFSDVTRKDLMFLDAWLYVFGFDATERKITTNALFEDGVLLFSNLKHYITIYCRTSDTKEGITK